MIFTSCSQHNEDVLFWDGEQLASQGIVLEDGPHRTTWRVE